MFGINILYLFSYKQDYTSVDGSPLPRCNQETHFSASSSPRGRARCPAEHVVNPNNVFRIIQNIDLQKETAYQSAVQVKPQHVSLKLRISEWPQSNLSACAKHFLKLWKVETDIISSSSKPCGTPDAPPSMS